MLRRLLGHTTLMMTNRYCQAVGCYDAVQSHKRYNRVNNSFWIKPCPTNRTSEKPFKNTQNLSKLKDFELTLLVQERLKVMLAQFHK